jgi:hypothetical protein
LKVIHFRNKIENYTIQEQNWKLYNSGTKLKVIQFRNKIENYTIQEENWKLYSLE